MEMKDLKEALGEIKKLNDQFKEAIESRYFPNARTRINFLKPKYNKLLDDLTVATATIARRARENVKEITEVYGSQIIVKNKLTDNEKAEDQWLHDRDTLIRIQSDANLETDKDQIEANKILEKARIQREKQNQLEEINAQNTDPIEDQDLGEHE